MKGINSISNITMIAVLLVATPVLAIDGRDDAKCEATKQKIQRLQSKMRQGYTAGQGIRMDEQMRRLKKQRSQYCR